LLQNNSPKTGPRADLREQPEQVTLPESSSSSPPTRLAGSKLFGQPQADAWNAIVPLLQSGAIKPIVAKTFPLAEAADALRYLVEGRPFGRVILTI
jgi:NADPH:quinone reductase